MAKISAYPNGNPPVDSDEFIVARAGDNRKLTWANIKAAVGGGGSVSVQVDQTGGTSDTYGVLAGAVNGSNKRFTVSLGSYISGSLQVYYNGQLQTQGTAEDWTETTPASGTFDFITAPPAGALITAVYQFTTGASGDADTLDGLHSSAFSLLSSMSAANALDLTDGGVTALHKHNFLYPFGVYANLSPMTVNGDPYGASIDRTITFVNWSQYLYVATTNNGSNYWTIELKRITDSAVINSISTAALSANTQYLVQDSSFSISSVGVADKGMWITTTKTGSPGALYMFGPTVEVYG